MTAVQSEILVDEELVHLCSKTAINLEVISEANLVGNYKFRIP